MTIKHRNNSDSTAGEPNTLREDVIEVCEILRQENRHCELLLAKMFATGPQFRVFPVEHEDEGSDIMFYTLLEIEKQTNFDVISINERPYGTYDGWYALLYRQAPLPEGER